MTIETATRYHDWRIRTKKRGRSLVPQKLPHLIVSSSPVVFVAPLIPRILAHALGSGLSMPIGSTLVKPRLEYDATSQVSKTLSPTLRYGLGWEEMLTCSFLLLTDELARNLVQFPERPRTTPGDDAPLQVDACYQ